MILASDMATWIDLAASGSSETADVLGTCLTRFLQRHTPSVQTDPCPGTSALLRLFRAAAILTTDGTVRSTEFLRIPNADMFLRHEDERTAVIKTATWDDKAALFSKTPPPRRTIEIPSMLDWAGDATIRAIPDQIRQLEYSLNAEASRSNALRDIFNQAVPLSLEPGQALATSHRSLRTDLQKAFAALLTQLLTTAAERAIAQFRARLDAERMGVFASAGLNSVLAYNWLAGHPQGRLDKDRARNRLQAVQAYPLAWPLLSATDGPVAHALANATSLIQALSAAVGVPEATIRRMNKLGFEEAGIGGSHNPGTFANVARIVGRMPSGNSPQTSAGWRAYFSAVALADAIDGFAPGCGSTLLQTACGRWDTLNAGDVAQASRGIVDMFRDFNANVTLPAAIARGIEHWRNEMTAETLIGGRTLEQVAAISVWWHVHQTDIRAKLRITYPRPEDSPDMASWPPLHIGGHSWEAPNGLKVVVLTDEVALADEGKRMSHCVDQYAVHCLRYGSHVVSVRDAAGNSLGTAEIRQSGILPLIKSRTDPPDALLTTLPPAVNQFQGPPLHEPSDTAWEALWGYISGIVTGSIEVNAKGLESALEFRRATLGGGVSPTCYNTSAPGAIEASWASYGPMLPKSVFRRGPFAFLPQASPADPLPVH